MIDKRKTAILLIVFIMGLTLACEISLGSEEIPLETAVALTVSAVADEQPKDTPLPVQEEVHEISEQDEVAEPGGPAPTPSKTPIPCNWPDFQSETIPDGTQFDPGDTFTKSWRIKNRGTCTWNTSYKLVFVAGDKMGGPSSKALSANVDPGETADLSVNLTAPASEGIYKGTWKIQADDGEQFGNYWVEIKVGEPDVIFAVSSVSFNGDQLKAGLGCPYEFNINAEISANAAGTVKYHWLDNKGYTGSVKSVTFDSAGTRTVTLTKKYGSGSGTTTAVISMYIDDPNHQQFDGWPIAVQCLP